MGAGLKSSFCLNTGQYLYVSQYLGDTTTGYEAQENYKTTLKHFFDIFSFLPSAIYIDKHPDYYSSRLGMQLADKYNIKYHKVQHHKAHFLAVLAENNLLESDMDILGVIFDGTGYGDDGNIWGGEFFIYSKGEINRFAHLDYFDFILADKMVTEPRISALAIGKNIKSVKDFLRNKFTSTEWEIYTKLLKGQSYLKTSSIGRLFDAAASLILGIDKQSYEGQAAMQLESLASDYLNNNTVSLHDSYIGNGIVKDIPFILLEAILKDLNSKMGKEKIAYKFHLSLCRYIINIAEKSKMKALAFSGGVFQNSVLVDMLYHFMGDKYQLYFHKQLSPNDECVSLGQMVSANLRLFD